MDAIGSIVVWADGGEDTGRGVRSPAPREPLEHVTDVDNKCAW
jgi:hypothetical protein